MQFRMPFSEALTNILGIQSLTQSFGAQQVELSSAVEDGGGDWRCDAYVQSLPVAFPGSVPAGGDTESETGSAHVVYVRDNLAVMPEHWVGGSLSE